MAKTVASLHSFNAGEASYAAMARIDQEAIRLTAERQENLLPYAVGKAIQRPGSQMLAPALNAPGSDSPPPFLIPFKKTSTDTALIELFTSNNPIPGGANSIFDYVTVPGAGSFVIPKGVFSLTLKGIEGGTGGTAGTSDRGGGAGGNGGEYAGGAVSVTPGQTLYYNVGAAGAGGSSSGQAGSAGGETWARIGANSPPSSPADGIRAKTGSAVGQVTSAGGAGGNVGGNSGGGGGGAGSPSGPGSAGAGSAAGAGAAGAGGSSGGGTSGGAGGWTSGGVSGTASAPGQPGLAGSDLAGGYGSGGGGGGGGPGSIFIGPGEGGAYGGGGGGGSGFSTIWQSGASGGQGILLIAYTVTSSIGVVNSPTAARFYVDDQIVTYPSVTTSLAGASVVPNPGSNGWVSTVVGDGVVSHSATGLTMYAPSLGARATLNGTVTTGNPGVVHALQFAIGFATVGTANSVAGENPLKLSIGTSPGGKDLFPATLIKPGVHSVAFTPPGTEFYVQFDTGSQNPAAITFLDFAPEGQLLLPMPAPVGAIENLNQLQFTQSLDVIYCSGIGTSQPFTISRYGTDSWGISPYYTQGDGPFQVSQSDDSIYLTPSGTGSPGGVIDIIASVPMFTSGSIGELIQITQDSMNSTTGICGQNVSTAAFEVTGVQASGDRAWTATITGTWVGTIGVERSFNNQYSGFEAYTPNDGSSTGTAVTITSNGTQAVNDADDNDIVWYRFTFTSWISGTAYIQLNYGGYGFNGVARVISVTSSTVVSAEVISQFANTTPSNTWLEGEWNGDLGYPTAVALFDGRLWWMREDQFWGSVSNNYNSYATAISNATSGSTLTGDSSSIQRNIATGGSFDDGAYILALQRLVFGTSGAEISARSDSLDSPLTPTAITLKDGSTQGAAPYMPVKIDKRGVFIQRSTRKLYALNYNVYQSDYDAENLCRINEDIGFPENPAFPLGFQQLAVQRQPDTYIWGVRSDGVCCNLLYEPLEKVSGWFRVTTGVAQSDLITSVCVLPTIGEDAVYWVTRRFNIDGQPSAYFIEKMRTHYETLTRSYDPVNRVQLTANGLYQCDCHTVVTPTVVVATPNTLVTTPGALPVQSVSGLAYLNGRSDAIALGLAQSDGAYRPLLNANGSPFYTVAGGGFTLGEPATGHVTVGLAYKGLWKSSKLAYGAGQGSTALLQKKRVAGAGLLLLDTSADALLIGSDYSSTAIEAMDPMPRLEDLEPVQTSGFQERVYDKQMFPIANVWDTDARLCIEVNPGYAATLLGVVIGIDENETA